MSTGKKKGASNKKKLSTNQDKQVALQIYARVRCLMPWEPEKISLKIDGLSKVQNKSRGITNEYTFSKVFKPKQNNKACFDAIVMPMIANVLMGYNAVLIAYGQTGSGKTFSMLGKPKLGVIGILPMMLEYLVQNPSVTSVELSAVEAFGHHIAKIHLYDLFTETNQEKDWNKKKGDTSLQSKNATKVPIKNATDAHNKIIYAHSGSHFAPTGKNPESSRGHITFVSKIKQSINHSIQTSYFIMVDCAGSEGESAFTKQYISSVDKQTLMARRLEAGCINNGLSQLQIIFNELRLKGKLSNAIGNGLRRVLHPYINTKTYLSVLFCLSPSVTNSRPTEATLKFAVTAGMVKVSPIQTKKIIDFDSLVDELREHIKTQENIIEENNDRAERIQNELNAIKLDIVEAYEEQERKQKEKELNKVTKVQFKPENEQKDRSDFMSEITRQKIRSQSRKNLTLHDWNIAETFEESDHRKKHRTLTLANSSVISLDIEAHERIVSQVPAMVQLSIAAHEKEREDEKAGLYSVMLDNNGEVMDAMERIERGKQKKDAPKVIDEKENKEQMQEAITTQQTLQHMKDKTIASFAGDMSKLLGIGEDSKESDGNMREDVYSGSRYDEYLRLKGIDYRNLEKEELAEYADGQWLFYQQEIVVKKNLQQSMNVMTDYLQEEYEGLLSFFRVRKIVPKERIDIQW